MSAPLVSVIIPAYNCEQYVGEALDSVLAQGYPAVEIVVVDDGSSDGTADVAAAYGRGVKLIRQSNRGPAAARNAGVRASRGEFLAFLDADDVWLPGKLIAQVKELVHNPGVDIVHARFARWYPGSDGVFRLPPPVPPACDPVPLDQSGSGWLYPRLLLDSLIHIVTALVRRPLYEALGGLDESLRTGEDYDFWLRACTRTPVRKLDLQTALYRVHRSSTTRRPWPVCNEYVVVRRALQKFGASGPDGQALDSGVLDRRLAQLCFQHAYRHFWRGDPCVAAAAFVDAVGHCPRDWRARAYALAARLRCMARRPLQA